jgi:hypothetical protein
MPSNSDLWQRIQVFEIDASGAAYPFSARLARENHWSAAAAQGAIEEYRKFVYLVCVSPLPLTPSVVVDQVWHLHLLYTRSYWTDLCVGVLGRPLHHEPTKGGREQKLRFEDQYARTCALYEAEFRCSPPAEFWPSASERFAAGPSLQWVDLRRYWVVPKPTGLGSILWSAAIASLVLLSSCADMSSEDSSAVGSGSSLWPILLIVGVLAIASYSFDKLDKRRRDNAGERSERKGWWWDFSCGSDDGCGGCGGCGG